MTGELEHLSEILESLDRLERPLLPEEKEFESVLSRLIAGYDEKVELPPLPPHKTITFLMEHRGLGPADLLPVFGSRRVASAVISGKRGPSKSHIRRLAEFFKLSPEVFCECSTVTPPQIRIVQPTEAQRGLCTAHSSECFPPSIQDKVGIATSTLGVFPINGLRHPITPGGSGWYIWCGEDFSSADDFFQPSCIEHALEQLPEISAFLALPPGYRFLIHGEYQDVWFDSELLNI